MIEKMIDTYLPSYFNRQTKLTHEKYPDKYYVFASSDISREAVMIEYPAGRKLDVPHHTLQDMILMYERNGWQSVSL